MALEDCLAVRHSVRGLLAIVSAIFIWIGTILAVLQIVGATGGPKAPAWNDANTIANIISLNESTLRVYWLYKAGQLKTDVFIDIFVSVGLICLAYCVLVLRRVFRKFKAGQSDLPNFMAASFFIGAAIPSIEILQILGYTSSADMISQWPGLPTQGLQMLFISYNLAQGSSLYLWSTQFFLIPMGLILASILTIKTGELPKKHAIFGFVTAFFGFLTFILEIISFNLGRGPVGIAFGISYLIYGVVLLPSWTVWLGVELRRLKQEQNFDKEARSDLMKV